VAFVEQVNRRSQKAKHFYDADTGRYRAEFTISDRHYHTGLAWEDVDESLVDDTGAFDKKCEKTRHKFHIAGGGAYRWYPRRNVPTEYVDITEIQYYSNRWRTLNLPAAVWKQQAAEWDMANLYASITNTWRRVKTEFVLKNSSAYTRLRFAVAFTGLTYDHASGNVTSTTDGLVWGTIDKPTAVDANDAPVTVTATYTDGWIEWQAITTGAAFPITVDPTFTDGYGGDATTYKDCQLRNDATGTPPRTERNYGNYPDLLLNTSTRALLEFDLSSIAAGSTCDSATLSVYQDTQGTNSAFTLTVYSVASGNAAWIEGTGNGSAYAASGEPCWESLAADGSGGVTTAWAGSNGLGTSGTDYEASALGTANGNRSDANGTEYALSLTTTRVDDWFGGDTANYGVLLVTSASLGGIGSAEHSTTGYRPKLVVEYTEASSGATGTLTATLAAATLSGVGTAAIDGDLTATLGAATLTGVGTVAIDGDLTATLAAATLTASGTARATGTLTATLADATIAAAGTVANAPAIGTANITLAAATLAATGTAAIDGDLAATLGDATLAGVGSVSSPGEAEGTLNVTLADATLGGVGTVKVDGDAAITLADATLSGSGKVAIDGDLAVTLADATCSGTGQVADISSIGTANITLADATCSATGTVAIAATAAITLADATSAATGTVYVYGSLAVTLADVTLTGVGTVQDRAAGPGTRDILYIPERVTLYVPARKELSVDN
jgi:hypothetical protein